DLAEFAAGARLDLDDAVERGVGEDDIGGHALLLRLLAAPGSQCLEQGGVSGVELDLGTASATGPGLFGTGLLHRVDAQRDLLFPAQERAGRLAGHEHSVVAVGFEESAGEHLADDGLPLALGQVLADAPDAQALV